MLPKSPRWSREARAVSAAPSAATWLPGGRRWRSPTLATSPAPRRRSTVGLNHRASTNAAVDLPRSAGRGGPRANRGAARRQSARPDPLRARCPPRHGRAVVNVGSVAAEYGRKGIRAHCVCPGPIETRMLEPSRALGEDKMLTRTPLRRLGRPDEDAELALYLLSDKAAFMTGSVHTIDGRYLQGCSTS